MPLGYKPAIFVSSTCYDLGQVRLNIKALIENLGLTPVLSEHESFPVNVSSDTISNCLDNVKNKADILILIVGGRYGFQTANGKSVTNLEYLEAKKKGIPIFVFIDKKILDIIPLWEKNPTSDFSDYVDNNVLFEFVQKLKLFNENWVFGFNSSQDIETVIKHQIPYLFMESLLIKQKYDSKKLNLPSDKFSPKATKIVLDGEAGWEYKLFAELLKDYIYKYSEKRMDFKYGISFSNKTEIETPSEIITFIRAKQSELEPLAPMLTRLLNEAAKDSFGLPGESGDYQQIQYVCQRFVQIYCKYLDWRLSFVNLNVSPDFNNLLYLVSNFAKNAIEEIEDYVEHIHSEINQALDELPNTVEKKVIHLPLTLTMDGAEEFSNELDKLANLYFR
jgi:hypothetical protein